MQSGVWSCGLAVALAMTSVEGIAAAQPRSQAAAEALFDEAVKLRGQGNWQLACEKFQTSQRLAPARGTLLNIAECHERFGRVESAWAAYKKLLDQAEVAADAERQGIAQSHIRQLAPRLPRLTILLDGEAYDRAAVGVPLPVDPGAHQVEVTAPGHQAWKTDVQAKEATTVEVVIPKLVAKIPAASAEPAAPQPASIPPPAHVSVPMAKDKVRHPSSRRKLIALSVGTGAAVSLIAGGVFGLRARSRWNDTKEHCEGKLCDRAGIELGDDATSASNVANVLIAVGLAAGGVAGYLWATAPRDRDSVAVVPSASTRGFGMSLTGRF